MRSIKTVIANTEILEKLSFIVTVQTDSTLFENIMYHKSEKYHNHLTQVSSFENLR